MSPDCWETVVPAVLWLAASTACSSSVDVVVLELVVLDDCVVVVLVGVVNAWSRFWLIVEVLVVPVLPVAMVPELACAMVLVLNC